MQLSITWCHHKNKNGRVFRPSRFKILDNLCSERGPSPRPSPRKSGAREIEQPQLAFFTGAGLPTFFRIARFSSSARGDSTSAFALIRYVSRPPL